MGEVLSIIRVMPSGVDVDLDRIKEEIEKMGPESIEEKPVAFGLRALEVKFIRPDEAGGTEGIEEKLRSIEGVESVQVTGVTLI